MGSPFSRTLRSLHADEHRRRALGLLPALVLLSAWAVWFFAAHVSVYEVTDAARLVATREAHPIAAPVDGRVVAVRAVLGQEVRPGDVLIELEGDEQRDRLEEERSRQAGLSGQAAALRQQIAAERRALADGRRAATAASEEARAKASEAEAAAHLAEEDAQRQTRLLVSGLVSEADVQRARSIAEQRREAAKGLRLAVDRLVWDQRSTESERRAKLDELQRDLAEIEAAVASTAPTVRRLGREIGLRTIRAPVDGWIGEIARVTRGSVVTEGELLGMVVPRGTLEVVAEFPPESALGRIRPGQPARARLTGFPSAQYGDLRATVARIAREPRDGRIRVELATHPDPLSPLPLQHGLPGTVEIEVERVTPATLVLRTVGKMLQRPAFATVPRTAVGGGR
ncbi:MAG TPA: HlyD family efflux transporter periplasmic adaptor subunit [Thermoanaerobaculia bacterium]|nr:HlyD family efflux transporter periplasmic adaptor subunit [Thermoanaerobaculia bacterium]